MEKMFAMRRSHALACVLGMLLTVRGGGGGHGESTRHTEPDLSGFLRALTPNTGPRATMAAAVIGNALWPRQTA
jgi:hypothetical protein